MSKDVSSRTFTELPLHSAVAAGIQDAGFTHCTPIQEQTLPLALAGKDVAGQAQTGTGKTAAFLVAGFNRLLAEPPPAEQRGPRMLVLAPTRELAVQIHLDAQALGGHTGLRLGLVYGGTDYEKQRENIRAGVDVLIGTPGRVIDYFKQRVFNLRSVQVMVLDEADRMFDLGFIKDIRFVMRRLPPLEQRLSLLFSATLSYRVLELAYEHMNDPQLVRVESEKITADRVRQVIYFPSNEEKLPLLIGLLRAMDATRTMVFVNTRREAEFLSEQLNANGVQAEALSGDVPQRKRLRMLRDFQAGTLPVLIATDVASRGLHVPDVSHVFNYDLPQDAEDYVHRIGRTARAGAEGDAVSFGCERYVTVLPEIEGYIGQKIPVGTVEPGLLAEIQVNVARRRRERTGPPRAPSRDGARRRPARRGNPRGAGGPEGNGTETGGEPRAPEATEGPQRTDGPARRRRRRRRPPGGSEPAGS